MKRGAMRRADRLFKTIQFLRLGRVLTARHLAAKLEVSERTVYRDVRDLVLSGVPIEGEAGVGYTLRGGYDLPPLMFSEAEMEALVIGARMVGAWGGKGHGTAAEMALAKIETALPAYLRKKIYETMVFSPSFHITTQMKERLDTVYQAVLRKTRLAIRYVKENSIQSRRTVRPLGLFFWGKVWTLAAWCELRKDFRTFRIDRIAKITPRGGFKDEQGKTLEEYLKNACEA